MDATERLAGKEAAPASRAPTVAPPEPVDELDLPDEDDDALGNDGDFDDEIPTSAAPPVSRPALPERRCRTKTCLKKFQPTHSNQFYCGTCRGLRINENAGAPKSTSWWANATSREDFQQRARSREDEMRNSKEKFHVPNQILGEGKR